MMPCLDRIVIVGDSCAGKSTLGRALSSVLGTDHVELDRLWWLPGWQCRQEEEFRALVNEATRAPRWIVDGNYPHLRDLTWDRATAVVWLNYAFARIWGRALRRTFGRVVTRAEICNGNRETLKQALFTRDSILWWILTTHRRRRRTYRVLFDEGPPDGQSYIELQSPKEADRFLSGMGCRPAHDPDPDPVPARPPN